MISVLRGDVFEGVSKGSGRRILLHNCNNIGKWGKGFVLELSKVWKQPEEIFKGSTLHLGDVQKIEVDENIIVYNCVGQDGIYSKDGIPPIRYDAIRTCFEKILENEPICDVYMPKIGTGLAGGKWNLIEQILLDTFVMKGFSVYVYEL